MREVIASGKTVEEATENGCRELGLGRDEVSVEILELPVKKLFKSTPAKVKVTADEPAQEKAAPEAEKPKIQPAPAAAAPEKPATPAAKKPAAPVAEKPAAAAESPKPARAPAAQQPILPSEPEEDIDMETSPRVKMAADYLLSILSAMGAVDVQLSAMRQGDATLLRVESEQVADKIEVRGETIQALSYLIDRAVNAGVDKKSGEYLRIRLDVAGYRGRRESELVALAIRTGKEVARSGRSRTLAPMNPYERLIVHTAISSIEGITSESIGTDTERRVVIKSLAENASDGGDWRPPRKGRSDSHDSRDGRGGRSSQNGGGNRGGGRSRSGGPNRTGSGRSHGGERGRPSFTPEREYAEKPHDPDAAPVVPERREAIRDGDDLPLYGKIDI